MNGWDGFDFTIAGALVAGVALIYLLLVRTRGRRQRVILGIALGVALLLVWAELAVGVFGTPFAGT